MCKDYKDICGVARGSFRKIFTNAHPVKQFKIFWSISMIAILVNYGTKNMLVKLITKIRNSNLLSDDIKVDSVKRVKNRLKKKLK